MNRWIGMMGLLGLVVGFQALAGDGYRCQEQTGTQFRYQEGAWQSETVEAGGSYRVVRSARPDAQWEVTLLDHDLTVLCTSGFTEAGWMRCEGLFTFVLRDNNLFMAIHDVPYALERMGRAVEDEYAPYVSTGACEPLTNP